jgi:hypothetical protein
MQEANAAQVLQMPQGQTELPTPKAVEPDDTVSTHVLVGQDEVAKLRELSRRTRVAQSEYLREAVNDLLGKYDKLPSDEG